MKGDRLKVFFLSTMNAGVAYYRMWSFKQSMNRQKLADCTMPWYWYENQDVQHWQFHVIDDPRVYARTGVINTLCRQADVVIVQYLHSWESLALIEALKACHPKTVFLTEIDDDVLNTPPWNDAFTQYQPGWKYRDIIVAQLKALDGIVVSTPYLKDVYSEYNQHVYVVPNALDFQVWDKVRNEQRPSQIRIGWMGGASHNEDLKTIETPIKEVLQDSKNVWFHCVHGVPEFFKNQSKIVAHSGVSAFAAINRYPKKMGSHGFDIGIAPLFDCSFNRGKSNLRKLEYGGLKIPVVAASVGEFKRTVKHGKDGLLYSSPEEFKTALKTLINNEKLRRMMGKYNYLDVKANYNVDQVSKYYVDVLKEALARGQTTKIDVASVATKIGENKWIAELPETSRP